MKNLLGQGIIQKSYRMIRGRIGCFTTLIDALSQQGTGVDARQDTMDKRLAFCCEWFSFIGG